MDCMWHQAPLSMSSQASEAGGCHRTYSGMYPSQESWARCPGVLPLKFFSHLRLHTIAIYNTGNIFMLMYNIAFSFSSVNVYSEMCDLFFILMIPLFSPNWRQFHLSALMEILFICFQGTNLFICQLTLFHNSFSFHLFYTSLQHYQVKMKRLRFMCLRLVQWLWACFLLLPFDHLCIQSVIFDIDNSLWTEEKAIFLPSWLTNATTQLDFYSILLILPYKQVPQCLNLAQLSYI